MRYSEFRMVTEIKYFASSKNKPFTSNYSLQLEFPMKYTKKEKKRKFCTNTNISFSSALYTTILKICFFVNGFTFLLLYTGSGAEGFGSLVLINS